MQKKAGTHLDDFTIRFAEEKDTGAIFGMIKELAEYEKLLNKFEATEQLIKETLFQRKIAEALIAEDKEKAVGYAIFFYNFSTFAGTPGIYIEDIYVKPEMRGRGCGKALFAFIAKLAVERRCGRLEWACLDWNAPAGAFYEGMGAQRLSEWTLYRLKGKNLEHLAQETERGASGLVG